MCGWVNSVIWIVSCLSVVLILLVWYCVYCCCVCSWWCCWKSCSVRVRSCRFSRKSCVWLMRNWKSRVVVCCSCRVIWKNSRLSWNRVMCSWKSVFMSWRCRSRYCWLCRVSWCVIVMSWW